MFLLLTMYFFWDFVILKIFTFPHSHSTLHQCLGTRVGSKVEGPHDLTIGSHFGSTSSKFKTLTNPNYTSLPLSYFAFFPSSTILKIFTFPKLSQYTSSVVQGL